MKLSPEFLESCYTPIIQSGGKFDLKPSAFSNGDNLYYGAPAADRPSLPAHARLACFTSRVTSRLTTRLPPHAPSPHASRPLTRTREPEPYPLSYPYP